VEGAHQWLVVRKDHETATLQKVAEMADRRHDRQQLPVEGAVVDLGLAELSREKTKWAPGLPAAALLNHCTYST
jgi:hypothetical protein